MLSKRASKIKLKGKGAALLFKLAAIAVAGVFFAQTVLFAAAWFEKIVPGPINPIYGNYQVAAYVYFLQDDGRRVPATKILNVKDNDDNVVKQEIPNPVSLTVEEGKDVYSVDWDAVIHGGAYRIGLSDDFVTGEDGEPVLDGDGLPYSEYVKRLRINFLYRGYSAFYVRIYLAELWISRSFQDVEDEEPADPGDPGEPGEPAPVDPGEENVTRRVFTKWGINNSLWIDTIKGDSTLYYHDPAVGDDEGELKAYELFPESDEWLCIEVMNAEPDMSDNELIFDENDELRIAVVVQSVQLNRINTFWPDLIGLPTRAEPEPEPEP